MAFLDNKNVIVRGIAAAVPSNNVEIRDMYRSEWGNAEDFMASTTIERLRISTSGQTSSDLCFAAADKLIEELGWSRVSIEALIFVTQTPDYYFVPATACHIQHRLGLSKACLAFDITLGCSGWVYGIGVVSSLLNNGSIRRAILLCGDTCSKIINPYDQGTAPLFGDAGTATALEYDVDNNLCGIKVNLQSDGEGYDAIICREGAFRNLITTDNITKYVAELHGNRPLFCSKIDGMSVFSFAISQAPKSIEKLIEYSNIEKNNIDILALHQANALINQKIIKKVKFDNARYPQSMKDFGNTSCASIPLSLVTEEAEALRSEKQCIIACGFGVGLSWGSVAFETNNIIVPSLIEI